MFGWLFRKTLTLDKHVTHLHFDGEAVWMVAKGVETKRFRWDDVVSVFSYKVDCYSCDLIYVAFTLTSGVHVRVHEEMEGYESLIAEMQRRCTGYRKDWWRAVAIPAFEENLTIVWKRKEQGVGGGAGASP